MHVRRITHHVLSLVVAAGDSAHKKDLRMFLKSVEGAGKSSQNTTGAETTTRTLQTINAWLKY
jgi:hypothetical protein